MNAQMQITRETIKMLDQQTITQDALIKIALDLLADLKADQEQLAELARHQVVMQQARTSLIVEAACLARDLAEDETAAQVRSRQLLDLMFGAPKLVAGE